MHCPRCGQQQVSDHTKFCSKCGFHLGVVAEVLANGGALPQLAELQKKNTFLTRKNGLIFGLLWFIFFLLILTPIAGMANIDELAGVSAILGIFGGIMIAVASLFLLKPASKTFQLPADNMSAGAPAGLHGSYNAAALPPQQGPTASDYVAPPGSWRTPATGELARPGSVTEGTTKLLKKEENE